MTTSSASPAAPRFALAWATLACVLAAFTLAHPALGGAFLVNPVSDQYIAGYAFREFAAASLRESGAIPLWNPYLFGGMPYVAAMHGDIFYPTAWLRMIMPTDAAMTWGMILHIMIAGVATYAFLRAVGLGFYAALVGGLAYMMSGQVVSLVSPGHDGKLFVSALFPIALLLLTWGVRDGRRWTWGLLALTIGLGVLSPHPQLLQYLLLATGAWALMLAFGGVGERPLDRKSAMVRLGLALAAVLVGAIIGAIQYLPVREYVEWSPRAGGRDYAYATTFSMPIEELFNTYLPQFTGILENYWGKNGIHFHSEYLGVGVLFLAFSGLTLAAAPVRRRLMWFWVSVLVVSTLWALGGYTPFYQLVYAIIPGTAYFRAPSTIFFVTTFAVAVLAAMGAERVLAGQLSRRWLIGALAVGGAITLLGVTGALTQMAMSIADPRLLDRVEANSAAVAMGAWRSFLFLAATVAVAWMAGLKRLTPTLAGVSLAGLVVADSWTVEQSYVKFSAPAATLYASDSAIAYIQNDLRTSGEPARVIALELGEGAAYHDPVLLGDGFMTHRIRTALGYHGNELGRYQLLGDKERGWSQVGNPTFWGLANVKYLYTNVDSLPVPGARRVVGPVRNAAGTMVSLFQLPGEHPFAWVAPAIAKYPDDAIAQAVRAPTFPYRSVALIDTASSTPSATLTALPEPLELRAATTHYEPGKFTIELAAPAPAGSALVVSENYYPGWGVTVDGQPARAERANLSLMAVALPAGARKAEFVFDSAPYREGKRITMLAVIVALIATLAGVAPGRRKANA